MRERLKRWSSWVSTFWLKDIDSLDKENLSFKDSGKDRINYSKGSFHNLLASYGRSNKRNSPNFTYAFNMSFRVYKTHSLLLESHLICCGSINTGGEPGIKFTSIDVICGNTQSK